MAGTWGTGGLGRTESEQDETLKRTGRRGRERMIESRRIDEERGKGDGRRGDEGDQMVRGLFGK